MADKLKANEPILNPIQPDLLQNLGVDLTQREKKVINTALAATLLDCKRIEGETNNLPHTPDISRELAKAAQLAERLERAEFGDDTKCIWNNIIKPGGDTNEEYLAIAEAIKDDTDQFNFVGNCFWAIYAVRAAVRWAKRPHNEPRTEDYTRDMHKAFCIADLAQIQRYTNIDNRQYAEKVIKWGNQESFFGYLRENLNASAETGKSKIDTFKLIGEVINRLTTTEKDYCSEAGPLTKETGYQRRGDDAFGVSCSKRNLIGGVVDHYYKRNLRSIEEFISQVFGNEPGLGEEVGLVVSSLDLASPDRFCDTTRTLYVAQGIAVAHKLATKSLGLPGSIPIQSSLDLLYLKMGRKPPYPGLFDAKYDADYSVGRITDEKVVYSVDFLTRLLGKQGGWGDTKAIFEAMSTTFHELRHAYQLRNYPTQLLLDYLAATPEEVELETNNMVKSGYPIYWLRKRVEYDAELYAYQQMKRFVVNLSNDHTNKLGFEVLLTQQLDSLNKFQEDRLEYTKSGPLGTN